MAQNVDFGGVEEHEVVAPKEVMNYLVEDDQEAISGVVDNGCPEYFGWRGSFAMILEKEQINKGRRRNSRKVPR